MTAFALFVYNRNGEMGRNRLNRVIALTTDFGLSDHFVGTMKGVMLGINPALQFVDVCHHVPPQSIFDGAVTVGLAYAYFPAGTIHLVIVDPGVGSARRPLIVEAAKQFFVAPDNGVLSWVIERELSVKAWHVTEERYFLKPVSNTFHGRDVFAPVAAWLSTGVAAQNFGEPISDWVTIPFPKPQRMTNGSVRGSVIKVDQFGNLITNLSAGDAPPLFAAEPPSFRLRINESEVTQRYTSYAKGAPGEYFVIPGSSGFIEIVQNRTSAAKSLRAETGTELIVSWS